MVDEEAVIVIRRNCQLHIAPLGGRITTIEFFARLIEHSNGIKQCPDELARILPCYVLEKIRTFNLASDKLVATSIQCRLIPRPTDLDNPIVLVQSIVDFVFAQTAGSVPGSSRKVYMMT